MAKKKQAAKKKIANSSKVGAGTKRLPTTFRGLESYLVKEGWGKDVLTKLTEEAFFNIGVSFLNLKAHRELLIKAAEIFRDGIYLLSWSELDDLIAVGLFGRAAGCFFGAVRLSCSGQLTETWALLRACLENALYAFYIHGDPERAKIWTERHYSDKHRRDCYNVFKVGEIWKALAAKSPTIKREAKEFYDMYIDWGAHPNERSLFPNLRKKRKGSGFNLNILSGDPSSIRANLSISLLTASLVFRIFALIFPKEFNQPNLAIKISNLRTQTKPLLYEVARRFRSEWMQSQSQKAEVKI